eukprot:TRINITY_DN1005_c0_g1_i1.p1 TRINITY_DN1005_c0_g1~~TRINITY_DN1005_c0_g1_i1.p1  ORF type:complete len:110 (+),score=22.72 TRINITY_DN1005_c0_g1_i1:177-506(+)
MIPAIVFRCFNATTASLIEGDQSFLSQYVTTFAFSTEQANKLGLGPNKSITQVSESGNLVQLNASPLMITMYGEAHSDVGLMQTLGQELSQVLAPISAAVANLESQLEH